ncbi:MAG: Lrp/AsnC family transcriptional regulator [Chloroflexota bacterium]|nr:Lrp/AsnC family transcriptional regulator [Chloroflexota bacterium]
MIDDLDRRLVAELARDARLTSAELSRRLGVSDTTVRRRIRRLQRDGTITSTVVPDAAKLGYSLVALIALQVELGSIDEIAQSLVAYPNIRYVADCTGTHDMLIGAWFRSPHELSRFVKDHLARMPGIRRSETFLVLDVKKNETGWLQKLH